MRPHPAPPHETPRERQLREELFRTRWDLISLAPDGFDSLLRSYYSCETRSATYGWEAEVVDKIVERAEPLEEARPDLFGARANCPLCRSGSQSYYERGFALPEGLRRHLVGYGRSHQCCVMRVAMALAREHWDGEFAAGEAAEQNRKYLATEARRKKETLYVLGPKDSPLLVDEHLYWKGARSPDAGEFSLKWAEQRLFSLGFQINVDDRKRSYTKQVKNDAGEFVVYADPRQVGEITFRVFDATVTRGRKAGLSLNMFRIRDSWKNALPDKVAAGIAAAAASRR